jgi:hypothetical protein
VALLGSWVALLGSAVSLLDAAVELGLEEGVLLETGC